MFHRHLSVMLFTGVGGYPRYHVFCCEVGGILGTKSIRGGGVLSMVPGPFKKGRYVYGNGYIGRRYPLLRAPSDSHFTYGRQAGVRILLEDFYWSDFLFKIDLQDVS